MNTSNNVLIIGSGISGMEASLMLSKAGKKVYLVERLPLIGGNTIKSGESYPNMDCSTCLVSPIQQEILQDENIEVLTISTVVGLSGKPGNFQVKIHKKARYIDMVECLGCGMCYPVCPIETDNNWEENLVKMKAVYVPCAGALPNVPVIDKDLCLRLNGGDCNLCVEACMFDAIDFSDEDKTLEVEVGAVIVATGYDTAKNINLSRFGYGKLDNIHTSMEFERLCAPNGPYEGNLVLKNTDKKPSSVVFIHCVGRETSGYCSSVCCMYSFKHAHFVKLKKSDAKVYNLYHDICLPDKSYQKFYLETKKNISNFIFYSNINQIEVKEDNGNLIVQYPDNKGESAIIKADMVVLTVPVVPSNGLVELAEVLDIELDRFGYIATETSQIGSIKTSRHGVFVAGCSEGPKDIQSAVIQAEATVANTISLLNQ